jgi:nucleotide-binding universal stress UspA family protein
MPNERVLVIPVDDTDDASRVFHWMLENMYKAGDEIHLLNVIPRPQSVSKFAVAAIDFNPPVDPATYHQAIAKAEKFIVNRFLSKIPSEIATTPIVHIIKSEVDTGSIGQVICQKAEDLNAALVIMGSHNKGAISELFLGSVSQYVTQHCKKPVTIARA